MFWSRLKAVFGLASPAESHALGALEWQQALAAVPILQGFSQDEEQQLIELARHFLSRKTLTQLGVELSPRQQGVLALQAVLPILHLGLEWYRGFHEVIIIPEPVTRRQEVQDEFGLVSEVEEENAGESWPQGPLVLAWSELQQDGDWDGYNLVIHELAHKLDMLNGDANGLPPLHSDMRVSDWAEVMQHAYDDLNRQLDHDPDAETAIDPYAAENPAEFFAVTSEYFFSAPDLLHEAYPQVYAQLQLFYRQDPLSRLRQLQATDPVYQAHD